MASINNDEPNTIISGTKYADTINNTVMIDEDREYNEYDYWAAVLSSPNNVTINGGRGNDYIYNEGKNVTIAGGSGNDSIYNSKKTLEYVEEWWSDSEDDPYYETVTVDVSSPDSVSINSGIGNDYIYNEGNSVTIDGGDGNDTITNYAANVTINGGEGDDTIYHSYGDNLLVEYSSGDGNDLIYGFNDTSTLSIAGGNYSTATSGADVIVTVGEGAITLKNILTSVSSFQINDETITLERNIKLTDGDDEISVSGDSVTIDAGAGNDTITNSGDSVSIDAGEGNDTITNSGDSVSIDAGAGNDTITNSGNSVSIDAGAGADTVENNSSYVTITGGKGDDYISNSGYNVLFKYASGDGNDVINNDFESNSTLQITSGTVSKAVLNKSDIILTVGKENITLKDAASNYTLNLIDGNKKKIDVKLTGTTGNDSMNNALSNVNIDALSGNDSITNTGSNISVAGGKGDDSIINSGDSVTINGGDGNDLISLSSYAQNNLIEYRAGDGSDTIYGFDSNDTLSISGGTYSTATSGSDVIVTVGKETITLKDVRTNVRKIHVNDKAITSGKVIELTNGDDESEITRDSLAVNALGGNDTIITYGDSVTIDGGAGNDYVQNWGNSTTINGGVGKDYIENHGDSVSIAGGDGDDSILNPNNSEYDEIDSGDSVTLTGGKGNDYILNEGGHELIIAGDAGNDTILNNSTTIISYNEDAICDEPETVTVTISPNNVTISGGTGDDYISNSGSDVLFKYASGDGNDVIEGFKSDSTLQITSGTVSKARLKKSDIILTVGKENITLKDAASNDDLNLIDKNKKKIAVKLTGTTGNNTINNNFSNVKIDALAGNDNITNTGSGVSINAGAGNDSISNVKEYYYEDNSGDSVTINAGAGDDFISNEGGSKVILAGEDGNDSINNNGSNVTIDGGKGDDSIFNEDGTNISINGGAGNDSIYNSGNADSVTINGGSGNDFILNEFSSKVIIAGESGNDSIFNKATTVSGEEGETFLKSPDSVSINGGAGTDFIFNEGNYATLVGGDGNDVIENHGERKTVHRLWDCSDEEGYYEIEEYGIKVLINGGVGNDSILNDGGEDATITGGEGNDTIYSKAASVSINGGSGNDRISLGGSLENITIAGGTGNDTVYTSSKRTEGLLLQYATGDGNDLIKNWKAADTLSVTSGTYSTKTSGKNVIVTVGDGKITLGGAASLSSLNIEGIKKSSTTFTVTDKTKSPVTVDSAIKAIDASTRTKIVKITGNKLANTIRGGSSDDTIYGGKGNDSILGGAGNDKLYGESGNDILFGGKGKDSLWGGAGNDSLWGGSGNDTFIYQAGEGTDKIFDYSSGDMIQILKSNGKSVSKFTKSKFSDGTLSLTISGGGQISFENVTTSTDFNINGTSYQISGSKLRKNS